MILKQPFSNLSQKAALTAVSVAAVILLVAWAAAQPGRWHVIAAYRTDLDGRTPAQIHNARLAVQALDGKLLPPGGEFSFNKTVGSWSADRGYVKAPVSYGGELIPSWGGGVCQASTTLYNAALLAGLEILERHRHQFPPRYAPPGQDAAVAQYNIDLRFRNPYAWPVKIEAEVRGKWLICRIISRKLPDGDITIEREIREVIPPGEVVRVSGTGPEMGWRVVSRGAPGLRVAVYRRVTRRGESVRTLISEDTYPPLNRLVRGE